MQSTQGKIVLSAVLVLLFLVAAVPAGAVNLLAGDKAPNFSLNDIDGKRVTLEEFRGKTVVIAFWSTWCSRCEEELAFLRDAVGDRDDVAVLLVNQDGERNVSVKRVRRLKERMGIRFPILLDEGLVLWERYGINALPTSVVVDKNGEIRLVEPNFYWGSPDNLLSAISRG